MRFQHHAHDAEDDVEPLRLRELVAIIAKIVRESYLPRFKDHGYMANRTGGALLASGASDTEKSSLGKCRAEASRNIWSPHS